MITKPKIKVILSVYGDQLNHDEFSEVIELTPTDKWNKGDSTTFGPNVKKKESAWEYSTGFASTYLVEDVTDTIYKLVNSKVDKVSKYISKHNLMIKLFLVVEMTKDIKPGIYFSSKFIEMNARLGSAIDIDLYCYDE